MSDIADRVDAFADVIVREIRAPISSARDKVASTAERFRDEREACSLNGELRCGTTDGHDG